MSYITDPSIPLAPMIFPDPATAGMSIADEARRYRAMGLRLIALEPRSKVSVGKWGIARPPEVLDAMYAGGANMAVVTGSDSQGLGDIDADWIEVSQLLAHSAMLADGPAFGRENQPPSHFLFRFEGDHRITKFGFTTETELATIGLAPDDKGMVVEVRGNAHYTMFPPSVHPTGVRIAWKRGGEPPLLAWADAEKLAARVAFLAVMVRKWPRVASNRDEIAMALVGTLIRAGMTDAEADATVCLVAKLAGDEEWQKRGGKAAATRAKVEADEPTTGLSKLCELLGIAGVEPKLRKWITWGQPKAKGGKRGSGPGAMVLAADVLKAVGRPVLHHNKDFYDFDGTVYRPLEEATIRANTWTTLDKAGAAPNTKLVSNVLDALKAVAHLPARDHVPPCWINGTSGIDPSTMIPARNGLVDPQTGDVTQHGPDLFNLNVLPFDYNPAAPAPELWLAKLKEWWPGDDEAECIDLLQEWFGYLLTPDTKQQKILSVFGGKRCGKGTIVRVLTAMLGPSNIANPKIENLGSHFGREGLIGKTAAIITDMRVGRNADTASIAETLLTISGEDGQGVPRKNKTDWEGTLRTRVVMFSNDVFSIHDPSGALASRLIVLPMHGCWLGKEDPDLTLKLMSELPGILNWAIEGYRRLAKSKRFTALKSEDAAVIADISATFGSLPQSFITNECKIVDGATITKDELASRYREWLMGRGVEAVGHDLACKQLMSAMMGRGVRAGQSRTAVPGKVVWVFRGIRLLTSEEKGEQPLPDYSEVLCGKGRGL